MINQSKCERNILTEIRGSYESKSQRRFKVQLIVDCQIVDCELGRKKSFLSNIVMNKLLRNASVLYDCL